MGAKVLFRLCLTGSLHSRVSQNRTLRLRKKELMRLE